MDHLIVLLNGLSADELAVAHGLSVARASNMRVTLLRVLEQPFEQASSQILDPVSWHIMKVEIEANLQRSAEKFRETGLEAGAALLEGPVVDRIIQHAQENSTDLIIAADDGEILSQTLFKLLTHLNIPLLILRGSADVFVSATGVYRRILVPLDGSPRAEYILPLVTHLAQVWDADVLLAHIVRRPEMPRRTPLTAEDIDLSDRIVQRNRSEVLNYLNQTAERLGVDSEIRVEVGDNIPAALNDLIEREAIDLVALSAHGYSGETRWPYGSVASNLIAFGSVPILLVQDLPSEYHFVQTRIPGRQHGVE